jgi:hypothetical protein
VQRRARVYDGAMAASTPTRIEPDAFTSFGDLLRFLRRRAQLTQRELSIAVGYNYAQICRLEQGQHDLRTRAICSGVINAAPDYGT